MRFTLKDLPFRLRRKFHRLAGTRIVRSRYGVLMRANWQDATFRMCYAGSYGNALSDFLQNLDETFVFLDIGANQGLYSLIAAKTGRCTQAYAFEPVASTYGLLLENIEANRFGSLITPVAAAVSGSNGSAQIKKREAHSGGASLADTFPDKPADVETVRTLAAADLDDLVQPNGPIIVKIDVEGHEAVVIDQLLRSRHLQRMTAIFYEVDEAWHDPPKLEAALRSGGFSRFQRHGVGSHYDVLAMRGAE